MTHEQADYQELFAGDDDDRRSQRRDAFRAAIAKRVEWLYLRRKLRRWSPPVQDGLHLRFPASINHRVLLHASHWSSGASQVARIFATSLFELRRTVYG
jgi:hypothetical protein